VARSEPGGYNLFFTTLAAVAHHPNLRANLPYNPITDFEPGAMVKSAGGECQCQSEGR
jgi:hypothetical protein